jgi:hypothetical protein
MTFEYVLALMVLGSASVIAFTTLALYIIRTIQQ